EASVTSFAQAPNGGMIVVAGALPQRHRDLIIAVTARTKLPTVYFERSFVTAGGLASYGANETDQYRRAASYVDPILRGEKPADLPVQAPTKYELIINLKTAKVLGLAMSLGLDAREEFVIEEFWPMSAIGPKRTCHSHRRMSAFCEKRMLCKAQGYRGDVSGGFRNRPTVRRRFQL